MDGLSLQEYLHIVRAGPGQYYNKEGILDEAGEIVLRFGKRAVISGGRRSLSAITGKLLPSLDKVGIQYGINTFSGESSLSNVQKITNLAADFGADFIIGAGGGKSLDTAKIAADILKKPIVTIPTIAATCAGSSPLCILYSDDGVYLKNYYPQTNPDVVLVDPEVQLNAPIQYLKSGILDSLSKWYEGSASLASADNADIFDNMAIRMAGYLCENMMGKSGEAISAVERGTINQQFIDVVNMNIYTAGTIQAFGVKAVRNGIAHSVHNGLTVMKESHELTHGIKVGYGIAVQMIIQKNPMNEFNKLINFYKILGLNPTFKGLNLNFTDSNVDAVAQKTIESSDMQRPPFNEITKSMVLEALNTLETLQ